MVQIIVRKSDNLVRFIGNNFILDENGLFGHKFKSLDTNIITHDLIEVDNLPDNFVCYGYTYLGGVFTINQDGINVQAEQQTKANLESIRIMKSDAKVELIESDKVALRCFKAGVPYPVEWKNRDIDLRDTVDKGLKPITSKPTYPQGT